MAAPRTRQVSLALQGGGAHGAFTWGVLDYLLEDGRLMPSAMTATSAGAINAVSLVHGYATGGFSGARQCLESLWRDISLTGATFRPAMFGGVSRWLPFLDALSRVTSPYDLNPFDIDPLRDILKKHIDFKTVQDCSEIRVFAAATCVTSGRSEIFKGEKLTLDAVLASASLPFIRQAVEIDGRPYWDGGFTGNPALWPLFYNETPRDLIIVHINPLHRSGTPKSAEEIMNRVNEITFNASLLGELRAIAFVKKLFEQDMLKDPAHTHLRDILVHSIKADELMRPFPASTKYDTSWHFLTQLKDLGRMAARDWLSDHYDQIGKSSSVDLKAEYLDET